MKPKWLLLFVGAWFLIGLLGLYNLSLRPATPAEIQADSGGLYADNRRITAIDHQSFSTQSHLVDWIDLEKHIGDTLQVEFGGGEKQSLVLEAAYARSEVAAYGLVGIVFFVLSTILGLGQKREDGGQMALAGYCWGFIIMVAWQGMKLPLLPAIVVNTLYFVCYPQACIQLLLFAYQFPAPSLSSAALRRIKQMLQFLGMLFSCLLIVLFFRKWMAPTPERISEFRSLYQAFYAFVLVTMVMTLIAMVRNTIRDPNPVSRRRLFWVVAGVLVGAFPFVFLWVLPKLMIGRPFIPEAVATLFALIIPISFVVAILRYRLFDIEIFLSRSLAYGTVVALLTVFYLLVLAGLSYLLYEQFSINSRFLSIVSAILVALFFAPVKARVQQFIDHKFFRIRYDRFRSIQAFEQDLENCSEENQMLQALDLHFQRSVPLHRSLFAGKNGGQWRNLNSEVALDAPLQTWLAEHTRIANPEMLVSAGLQHRVEPDLNYPSGDFPAPWVVWVPIAQDISWFLGVKEAGSRYWQEDLDLAVQMGQQINTHIERLGFMRQALAESIEREKAQKESEWKSMLVAEVAHDLRAPLNTMLWKLKNLETSIHSKSTDGKQPFKEVEQQVHKLQTFVQNLLMLSQKEHGKLSLKFAPVNVKKTVEEVIANLQSVLGQKELTIKIKCNEDLQVVGDAFMFQEIIMNLVENAAKYSPVGAKIAITAVVDLLDHEDHILITIRDQGLGIPQNILRNISEPFKNHNDDKPVNTGFSLGLYIVYQFAMLLNGQITIDSGENQGTTFELRFARA